MASDFESLKQDGVCWDAQKRHPVADLTCAPPTPDTHNMCYEKQKKR